jgi:hypothetical protein
LVRRLEIDDAVWNHAVFSKNRDRLLNQDLAQKFFAQVKRQAAGLMSDEHFTVDGTLIEAWAGQKSFRRKDEEGGSSSTLLGREWIPDLSHLLDVKQWFRPACRNRHNPLRWHALLACFVQTVNGRPWANAAVGPSWNRLGDCVGGMCALIFA